MAPLPLLAPIAGFLVLVELAAGTLGVTFLIDVLGRVGRGFVGTTALICAGVLGVALVIGYNLPGDTQLLSGRLDPDAVAGLLHWCVGLLAACLVLALFCAVGTDAARRVIGVAAIAVGAVAIAEAAGALGPALGGAGLAAIAFAPAAAVEGSALGGMLLGHWYLVTPSLSFRPLRQTINIVFIALGAEVIAIALALTVFTPAPRQQILAGSYALPFWLLVVGAGICFTAGVLLVTRHFARIRANQPATAMLYALIISVAMGVVPAHLLYFVTGAPV